MKARYFFIFFFSFICVACSQTDLDQSKNYDDSNIESIRKIALKYGFTDIEVRINHSKEELLTKEELDSFEAYYRILKEINNKNIKLKKLTSNSISRVLESSSYHGGVSYEGHSYRVAVYWMKDNETGEICNIEGGMGGSSLDTYPYPTEVANGIVYELVYQGKTIYGAGGGIIDLTLRGDYILKRYHLIGNKIDFDRGPYYSTISRVAASGRVNTNTLEGGFTMHYSGPGSWIEREF